MMKMKIRSIVLLLPLCAASVRAQPFETNVCETVVGNVSLTCANPGGWQFAVSQVTTDGVSFVTVRLSAPKAAVPPRFSLDFSLPGVGVDHVWTPYDDRYTLRPTEWGATPYTSQLAYCAPIAEAFRVKGESFLAASCSEAMRRVDYGLTIGASDCRLNGRFVFFTEPDAPLCDYACILRLDARKVFWADAVRDAADWISAQGGLTPAIVPDAAREPMYSTWYAFWQDVCADQLEKEAELAAGLGMKAMILDDGWQKVKSRTFYSATGDWMPVPGRFPDMAGHVAKVHAAGLKYLLWLSVPFVGDESKAYERFKGKFLTDDGDAAVLDPRFPEVRDYLVATCERVVRDWGFDGVKLDFIDRFCIPETGDPALKDGYAGRDIKSVPEAVDVLMKRVLKSLQAICPDVLVEFRQRYMGPAIRQYGNMIRAIDCPADSDRIRKLVCDLRLTSGMTAVHSDMLVWHPDETPERAARPILNSLFSTIQYSMVLQRLPRSHREVIRHWIDFTQKHRETLLSGAFRPGHPELQYPVVEASGEKERIVAVYADGQIVDAGALSRLLFLVNAADEDGVHVTCGAKAKACVFDVFGRMVSSCEMSAGTVRLAVPNSGYALVERRFE